MPVGRQYLKYEQAAVRNVVTSAPCNIDLADDRCHIIAGACEQILYWNITRGERVRFLPGGENAQASVLKVARGSRQPYLAVGYTDGGIRIFESGIRQSNEPVTVFKAHRSAVNCLAFDSLGLRLASGGRDCSIIVWDLVERCAEYRLNGHKGPVTQLCFLRARNILVSSSKDSLIKFWNLDARHCFSTLLDHRSEVWDFLLLRDDSLLVTGSSTSELRVYEITHSDAVEVKNDEVKNEVTAIGDDDETASRLLQCRYMGQLERTTAGRVVSLQACPSQQYFVCLGTKNECDAFHLFGEAELKKRITKQLKKHAKRLDKQRDHNAEVKDEEDTTEEPMEVVVKEEVLTEADMRQDPSVLFCRLGAHRCQEKIKSVVLWEAHGGEQRAAFALSNNSVEMYRVSITQNPSWKLERLSSLQAGHRSDARSVSFSHDSSAFMSASGESVKLWNRASAACIRTMQLPAKGDAALCSFFVTGDRHCVVGCKSGALLLYDIASASLLNSFAQHEGTVWALAEYHDQSGLASASDDKTVKFWSLSLERQQDSDDDKKVLTLHCDRTLQLDEPVLSLKISANGKFIACGLLDNTVKIFFVDSLKFFLSLYGHSLPILCLDISDDSHLVVTGAADKNVKLWGLDFGDCHKSLFAHDESVTAVAFVARTHLFFSAGRDGRIVQWDGDKFDRIQVLSAHHAEVWSMAISPNGYFLVSSSHDRSIRLWEQTQEPVLLSEQREKEIEDELDTALEREDVIPGERMEEAEAELGERKTVETVKAAESIIDALEICHGEDVMKHPLIVAYGSTSPARFVLDVARRIRASELDKSLIALPYAFVLDFLQHLVAAIEQSYELELACKCLFALLRIHHPRLTSSPEAVALVDRLRRGTRAAVMELRDTVGFNLAALKLMQLDYADKDEEELFHEALDRRKSKQKKKKKAQAYVLTMS